MQRRRHSTESPARPSTIAGQINANGQVFLVNPNGIAITATGTVNVGGFRRFDA
jgi:filamentous hemagglutinin family protein